jgi:hypothetical protein
VHCWLPVSACPTRHQKSADHQQLNVPSVANLYNYERPLLGRHRRSRAPAGSMTPIVAATPTRAPTRAMAAMKGRYSNHAPARATKPISPLSSRAGTSRPSASRHPTSIKRPPDRRCSICLLLFCSFTLNISAAERVPDRTSGSGSPPVWNSTRSVPVCRPIKLTGPGFAIRQEIRISPISGCAGLLPR